MGRTKDLKKGLKAATVAVFFAAALLSTGCSNNALLNPQPDLNAQGGVSAQGSGHSTNPSGHSTNP